MKGWLIIFADVAMALAVWAGVFALFYLLVEVAL